MSFQELATRVSHRNTGKVTNDPIADKMLARISKDENLHMVFYRNIVAAALEIAPDATMRAIADEVIGFEMPGATMAGFRRNSTIIAKAGIYDLRLHHDDVIMPVLRHWDVFDRTDLGAGRRPGPRGARRRSSGTSTRRPRSSWTGAPSNGPATRRTSAPTRTPTSRPDGQAARAVLSLRTRRRNGVSGWPRRTRGSMSVRPSRSAIIWTASVSYSPARRSASCEVVVGDGQVDGGDEGRVQVVQVLDEAALVHFSPHDWMSSHQSQRGM